MAASPADTLSSVPDTTRAAADTAAVRGARKLRRLHSWTRASLPAAASARGPGGFVLPRDTALLSTEAMPRDEMEWSGGMRHIPGPAYNAPDPIDPGDLPGREPAAYLLDGTLLGPSGYPEMTPDPVGAFWLEQTSYLPADPLLLPSNPSGGPIVALELLRPDSSRSVSGFRLTSGSNGLYTEDFFVARPSGSQLTRFGYGDSKTDGRYGIGYFSQFGENLLLRTERGTAWGGWRLGWRKSKTRVGVEEYERYLHDRTGWDGGLALRRPGWVADLSLALSQERLAWEASVPASRKESVVRGLLRIEGRGAGLRPMLTLQLDRQRRRFEQPAWPAISEDRTDTGPGLAGGVDGVSGSWQLRASAGWATPAPGKAGWVAAATAERPLSRGWVLRLHADRCLRGALVPRLAGDMAGAVGQGAWVSGLRPGNDRLVVDPDRRLEAPARAETSVEGTAPRTHWTLHARGVRIDHAVAPGPGELRSSRRRAMRPCRTRRLTARCRSPPCAASRRSTWAAAWHSSWTSLAEQRNRRSMTSCGWRPGTGECACPWVTRSSRRTCGLEGFAQGAIAGPRSTPYGELATGDRYDAGFKAQIADLSLFVILLNLENEYAPAADYGTATTGDPSAATWSTLPLRTYRVGLTWRFLN